MTTAQGGPVADDQNSLDDFLQDSTARDFVADALAHCKFIGYVDAALPLLRKAGISGDDMDEGCVVFDSAKDAKTFVDNLGKLRVWGASPT